jgi:hypothetical protein
MIPIQDNRSETPDEEVATPTRRQTVDFSKPPKGNYASFAEIWDYLKASIDAFMDGELRVYVTPAHYMAIHHLVFEFMTTTRRWSEFRVASHKDRELYRLMKEYFNDNPRLNTALEVSLLFSILSCSHCQWS